MSIRLTGDGNSQFMERKQSYSSTTCNSDSPTEQQLFNQLILPSPYEFRHELFNNHDHSNGLSQKMNQKAVSWLATACWSKDLSQQCFWQATLLYYCLKSKKKVEKQNLQLVLITCLNLAMKMSSSKARAIMQVSGCSKGDSVQKIRQMQVVILEQLDYNLFIPHYLNQLLYSHLPPEQLFPLLFVCQLLLINNSSIFFDKQKIQTIAEMLGKNDMCRLAGQKQLCQEIQRILKWKQSKIIVNKYAPKFDIDGLLKKLNP